MIAAPFYFAVWYLELRPEATLQELYTYLDSGHPRVQLCAEVSKIGFNIFLFSVVQFYKPPAHLVRQRYTYLNDLLLTRGSGFNPRHSHGTLLRIRAQRDSRNTWYHISLLLIFFFSLFSSSFLPKPGTSLSDKTSWKTLFFYRETLLNFYPVQDTDKTVKLTTCKAREYLLTIGTENVTYDRTFNELLSKL